MSRLRAQRMTRGNKTWLGICPSWLGPWTWDILALIWDLWVFTWDIWLIVMTLAGVYVGLVGVDLRLDPTLYLRADLSYRLREQLETLLLTRQTISVWLRLTFFQKDPRHQWYVQGLQIVPGNTTVSLARSLDHGDLYYDGWKISAGSDWRYQHHHGPSPGETLMAPCSIQKLKEDWQLSVGVKIGAYCTYIEGKTGGREKMIVRKMTKGTERAGGLIEQVTFQIADKGLPRSKCKRWSVKQNLGIRKNLHKCG